MKNIWRIYKRDLRKICKNPIALTVAIGIMILPSLYAWFNIKASWDPYGNTQGILVAVSNDDVGYTIDNEEFNIGDKIIEKLEGNTQMGWQFVDTDKAIKGAKSGKYYAAIVIPPDFSEKLSSILEDNVKMPQIDYYVNEKKNAIAPKITDKGVSSIQNQINETFVQTITEISFKAFKLTDDKLQEHGDPIKNMINMFEEADKNLQDFSTAITAFENLSKSVGEINGVFKEMLPDTQIMLDDGVNSVNDFKNLIDVSRDVSDRIEDSVDDVIESNKKLTDTLSDSLDVLYSDMERGSDDVETLIKNSKTISNNIVDVNDRLIGVFRSLNEMLPIPLKGIDEAVQKLSSVNSLQRDVIKVLNDAKTLNVDAVDTIYDMRKQTNKSIDEMRDQMDYVQDLYRSDIKPAVNESVDGVYNGLSGVSTLIIDVNKLIPNMQKAFKGVDSSLDYTLLALENTNVIVKDGQKKIRDIVEDLNSVSNDEKWDKMLKILRTNPELAGDFMSSPVEINYNYLYPIENYGSAMTPFYTVLCLWVGGLILVSILKTRVKEDEHIKNLLPSQAYFGRYLLFMTMGIIQSLIVCLGNLYLLKVQCQSPLLFILAGVFCSIVFTLIIYTMTLSFGDVGKAISIVLLVIQVAGAGGTFPIEVTPPFFRAVNPMLPFTHGINAMRECVAGVYMEHYIKDLVKLSIFIPMALFVGLYLRKPLIKLTEFFEEKLEETGIM